MQHYISGYATLYFRLCNITFQVMQHYISGCATLHFRLCNITFQVMQHYISLRYSQQLRNTETHADWLTAVRIINFSLKPQAEGPPAPGNICTAVWGNPRADLNF